MAQVPTPNKGDQHGNVELGNICKSRDDVDGRVTRKWAEGNMKAALEVALNHQRVGCKEKLNLCRLAKEWDVPVHTLRRRISSGDCENYKHVCLRGPENHSSHSGMSLYQWNEDNMKEALWICLDDRRKSSVGRKLSMKRVAHAWRVPVSTLYKRVQSGDYDNYKHIGYSGVERRRLMTRKIIGPMIKGM